MKSVSLSVNLTKKKKKKINETANEMNFPISKYKTIRCRHTLNQVLILIYSFLGFY